MLPQDIPLHSTSTLIHSPELRVTVAASPPVASTIPPNIHSIHTPNSQHASPPFSSSIAPRGCSISLTKIAELSPV